MRHADALEALVRRSDSLMTVLRVARTLDLPDWLIFSGAVYQKVFNHLTGRPEDYGLKDYDLAYFDASDTGWDAEDKVIRRVAAELPAPLDSLVEVRNQARVHLWFEGRFGEPYAPLSSSAEALEQFVSTANAVGVRLEAQSPATGGRLPGQGGGCRGALARAGRRGLGHAPQRAPRAEAGATFISEAWDTRWRVSISRLISMGLARCSSMPAARYSAT